MIEESTYARIQDILKRAGPGDYRPVLFVMPYEKVAEIALEVVVDDLAHPLSLEFRVDGLPRGWFDMIELRS